MNKWIGDTDTTLSLVKDASGYTLTLKDGSIDRYDLTGKLSYETDASGKTTRYYYLADGKIDYITGHFGHRISFGYNASNRIATVTEPDPSRIIYYDYDDSFPTPVPATPAGNLTRVRYPDGTAKIYHYNEAGLTGGANLPNHLTGISFVDAQGAVTRYSTYAYDSTGKAIRTEHAQTDNGAPQERFTLNYDSSAQTTVTDPIGTQEVMSFATNLGVKNLTLKVNQSDGKSLQQVFDGNNNLTCRKDEENRVTLYSYNGSNQKLSQTEGLTGDCANPVTVPGVTRSTSYQYVSPTLDLPTLITAPSVYPGQTKTTVIQYTDAAHPHLPTVITQNGYTPTGTAVSRSVILGYNASGQLNSIDGPRTDVADVTTLEYYDCTTGGGCGQLKKVINALGHVTSYDNYDANGRLLQMTDPNGLVTSYSYDPRGRVETVTRTPTTGSAATTQYRYTPWGELSQVIDPDGVALTYQYDAAQDLRFIVDTAGNYLHYQYDLKGNRIAENTHDSSGALMRAASYAYDRRNHLQTLSSGSITGLVNDAVGNLTRRTDGNQHTTAHQYDALNRLFRTVNALNQNTDYTYDVNDQLSSVTAPNNLVTQYRYDDLGNRLQEISPDRGNTTYGHDHAGNIRTATDQLGQMTTYTYDALNRVASRQSSVAGTPAYAYVYDACHPGALCAIKQNSADHLIFAYDGLGRQISRQDLTTGLTTRYSHTPGGRLASITYPNAVTVSYTYNNLGNISRVNALNTALADNIQHYPFGPVKSFRFGHGVDFSQNLDTAYRPWFYGLAYRSKQVSYDDAGNVRELNDSNGSGQSFAYDALDQLTYAFDTQFNSYWRLDYSYLANGRRKTKTQFNQTISYLYYGTNQLSQYGTDWLIYYGTGSVRSGSALGYLYYDGYERLTIWGYAYNAFDQRTRKVTPGGTTVFAYGPSGELLYESNGGNAKAYVYLGDRLLGRIDNGGTIYYYHVDHLGTPQVMTDNEGWPVWRASYEPFGLAYINLQAIENNVRLVGMYADQETGLYYWGGRYYDPKIGRGIQPDRMSVAEHVQRRQENMLRRKRLPLEINSYVYVANNPLRWIDRTGRFLDDWEPSGSITHDPIGWGLPGSTGSVCGSGFKVPEFSFRDACQKHDDCYGTCGVNKTWCDIQFQWNTKQSCPAGDWRCQLLANVYFEAVLHLGGGAFDGAQEKACKGGDCKK